MRSFTSKGDICVLGPYNIEFRLCRIQYTEYEDESFEYIFTPNYSVIDLLDTDVFQGIPGLNLDLRKIEYVRKNRIPVFISERVPQKNRVDYYELLEAVGMTTMDPIEYLIKTDLQYSGDKLYVVEARESELVKIQSLNKYMNTAGLLRTVLQHLAQNDVIQARGTCINDENRKDFYDVLIELYRDSYRVLREKQLEGIEKAKGENRYKGRKPIEVNPLEFADMEKKVQKKELNVKEAAKVLGISIDKYYRLRKRSV